MSDATIQFDRARFETILDAVERMAGGEIARDIPVSPARDELDALVHGVNILAHELLYKIGELEKAQTTLVQSAKLAALGEVSSGLAHELNNPLSIAIGFLEQLKGGALPKGAGGVDGMKAQKYLEKIDRALDRMGSIIRHFMEFARQSSPDKRPVRVNDVIGKSLILLSEQLRLLKIGVSLDLSPDNPVVVADALRLEQVFINILTNARDAIVEAHGEAGGSVEIRSSVAPGPDVVIEVRDNGIGMTEETRSRMFNPFYTTKAVGKGTGLGMSISLGIVNDHGGTIECESRPGGGARIRVRLPGLQGNGG